MTLSQASPQAAAAPSTAGAVQAHYGSDGIAARVLAAVKAAGGDPDRLTPKDLYPFDQLHARGLAATEEHVALLHPAPRQHLLDVGSGVGGPARYLAGVAPVSVVGIDVTSGFVEANRELTRRCGLDDRLAAVCGDALAMPFDDAEFDGALCLHVAMNIADPALLASEIHRVLRPGARLVWSQPVLGASGEPPAYPLPWAATAATSFLPSKAALRDLVEASGFRIETWRDDTLTTLEAMASPGGGAKPPELATPVLGGDLPSARRSFAENLRAGRLGCVAFCAIRQ